MNHILELIADYLENRLTPEQRREVEMHRDKCGECGAALAFAMKLQEEALAQGLAHIRPDRIIALSADRKSATAVEQQHLATCESCRNELAWASAGKEDEALAGEDADEDSRRRAAPSFARRWWPAATVAAAAVIALVIFLPRGSRDVSDQALQGSPDTVDYSSLASIQPLPVRINRSVSETDSFETARLRGLEFYRDADYDGARVAFGDALVRKPGDSEMLLYLGSAESMSGDFAGAAAHLEEALRTAEAPALREELLWQLANVKLATNDVEAAKPALTEMISLGLGHSARARELLGGLEK